MLELLFGNSIIEEVLFFLLANERCYASQLRRLFQTPIYSFQLALDRLENGGVVVSRREGRTRVYQFNPRYPFLKELKAFLEKAYQFLPEEIRQRYYEPVVRTRPRRKGKPL